MSWWQIIKGPDNHLEIIERMFNNKPEKAIGYIPVEWGVGKENEIQALASRLGLQYKLFPSKKPMLHETWHSYANGGHFMWDESKIEPYLEELPFDSVDSFINYIAVNSYEKEPWRRIADTLFGTPEVRLRSERR